jgi:hypothetical protein
MAKPGNFENVGERSAKLSIWWKNASNAYSTSYLYIYVSELNAAAISAKDWIQVIYYYK